MKIAFLQNLKRLTKRLWLFFLLLPAMFYTRAQTCPAVTVPYAQNFDSVIAPAIPACITVENVNGATTWATAARSVTGSSLPNVMLYTASATTPANDWFFLKGLQLTAGVPYSLSFRYSGSPNYAGEKMEVRVGTAPTAAAQTGPRVFNNNYIVTTATVTTTFTPDTTGVYYFGFHAYSDANRSELMVDNITVRLVCTVPAAPVVDSVTTTSATVRFTAQGQNFLVEYGPTGFTPGTAGTAGTGGTIVSGNSLPTFLTGLTSGETYNVYVRRNCIADSSGWSANSGKATFSTPCVGSALPYSEYFDSVVSPALPPCITIENPNPSGTWRVLNGVPSFDFSSPNAMRYLPGSGTPDSWFFLNAVSVLPGSTYVLDFRFKGTGLAIKTGTSLSATAAANGGFIYAYYSSMPFHGYNAATFTPTGDRPLYIGFHATATANNDDIYVDNINLRRIAACGVITNARIDSITPYSAVVKLFSFGNPVVVEYGSAPFTPGTGVIAGAGGTVVLSANMNRVAIDSLLPATKYYVYIRQNCSAYGNGYSANQLVDSFSTLPPPVPAPNDLPRNAIVLQAGAGYNSIYTNTAATQVSNEPGAACAGTQSTGRSVWFKFAAPASGFVRISTDTTTTTLADIKIALYAVGDSTDFSTFQIISCDDDNGVLKDLSSVLYATGLIPGRYYYLVVDDYYGTSSGTFYLKVDAATTSMIANTGSCTNGQVALVVNPDYRGWLSLTNNSGRLIANLRSTDTLSGPANFSATVSVRTGAVRQAASGDYYLNRNFYLTENTGRQNLKPDIQFFMLNTELAALQAATSAPLAGLNATRVTTVNGVCLPSFVYGGAGNDTLLLQTASDSASGISWITVRTDSLANFYLHSGTTPLSRLYVFTGNGAWSNPANWSNGQVPPMQLPPHSAIEIKPVSGGQCILDVPQRVPAGCIFRVKSGTNVVIPGSVLVQ